jgi:MFS family permease
MASGVSGKSDDDRVLSPAFVRVALANFCFFLTFASFFLLPLHVRALGGTERTVGFVMGTNGVAGLVSVFALGALLDRFDRRRFLLAGIALMLVSTLAYLAIDRIGPALYLLRVVQGVAFAMGFNAASTLAAELAPPSRRAAALGVFGVSTLGTHALAPTIGEWLVEIDGFPLLFVVAAGYCVVGFALAWGIPATGAHAGGRGRAAPLGRRFATTLVAVALTGVAFGTVVTFAPTFVHTEGLGRVSTFFLSYTAAAIATRFGGAGLGDRIGHRRVAAPALAVLGTSIACLALVHTALGLALTGVVFGTAQGICYPTMNAFVIEHVPPGQLGRIQTLFNGAFNLGVTAGSFGLGAVADAYGHRPVFVCAGTIAFAALGLFMTATRGAQSRATDARALDRAGRASG